MDNDSGIQLIGIEKLTVPEKEILNKLATEYYPKIKRLIKNTTTLVIHIKSISKGGSRKRFEINIRTIAPTTIFESSAEDWCLATALHKSLNELRHEIEHRFKRTLNKSFF